MKSILTRFTSLTLALLTLLLAAGCGGGESLIVTTHSPTPNAGFALTNFTTASFSGSGNCAVCHSRLKDAQGNDISIDTQWRANMMANAARDPFWQASVAAEVADNKQIQAEIEDACALCHAPAARTQAVADKTAVAVLGSGFLNASNSLHEAAMDGNTCSVCHQISAAGLGTQASLGGNYQIDTAAKAPGRPEYGPYDNPLTQPMQATVGYTPTLGAHQNSADLCGTCHVVYTPVVDEKGQATGALFPEQTGYLEWKQSAYAAGIPCQGCHMLPAGGAAISNNPTTLAPRSPFYQHNTVGANSLLPRLMANYVAELGMTASTAQLQAIASLAAAQLGARSASLSITNSQLSGGKLTLTLKVTDLAGHKFPTGFPSRRAWVHLTVKDASGKVVFESGKVNADGSIAGNDADKDAGLVEPHYDLITSEGQVQIYESVMGDTAGKPTYTLLKGATYVKDNRLLPNGFDKTKSISDTAVHGAALTDANFVGGSDTLTYELALKGGGPYTVTAELLYQEIGYRFAQNLFSHKDTLVSSFNKYYQSADKTPGVAASTSKTVS